MLSDAERHTALAFLAAHPPPGEPLVCALTGSHIYGFPSEDSDLDLKAIHCAPTRACLGLEPVAKSFERVEVFRGVECDYTSNEAAAALALMLRGNGNMLERILGPCILLGEGPRLEQLRTLARASLSRKSYHHYAGFFRGICRAHEKSPAPRAKSLLYAYRVALTGVHLLRTAALETRLDRLAPVYGCAPALELIAFKRAHGEKQAVPEALDAEHRAAWPRLDALLAEARDGSPLPDEAPNAAACSAWLVEQRLALL